MYVQFSDGLWKETVCESVSLGLDGPVESPRGQQIKQVGWRMGGVLCDCLSSAAAVGYIDVSSSTHPGCSVRTSLWWSM